VNALVVNKRGGNGHFLVVRILASVWITTLQRLN